MNNKKLKFVSPVFMWLIIILGIIIIFNFFSSNKLFSVNYFNIIFAIILFICGIFLFFWSIKFHKKAPLSTFGINKLVKEGPYKIIRHPIYFADIILGIGIFLLFPSFRIFLSLLWLIIVLFSWSKLEEKSLIKKFGSEYKNYMKITPMIIPNLKGGN